MKLTQYQVDAFAARAFEGNPAAICPLQEWLDDALMQSIAMENNLSETAFFVPLGEGFELRWFTPDGEVDMCGHATLASAYILFNKMGYARERIRFSTRSGDLFVVQKGDLLEMDFPAIPLQRNDIDAKLAAALGHAPIELWSGMDYVAIFENETVIRNLAPDQLLLKQLDLRGVIATARGDHCDFVSRFFAPKFGIPEDPVTGSAHCALAPYWAERLRKNNLRARQISKRGGDLECEVKGERVLIRGSAVIFMKADIFIDV